MVTAEQIAFWGENGYLALPGFFPSSDLAAVNDYVDRLWMRDSPDAAVMTIDVFTGTPKEARIRLKDAPPEARQRPYKLNDIYLESDAVRSFILAPRLGEVVSTLLGAAPLICNTLNLEYGSEQPFHTDSLYMTPPQGLNLVASWIALENCDRDAGPLRYYPGSHRIPPYLFSTGRMTSVQAEMGEYRHYMEAEVSRRGLKEERFLASAGDVFIWHSQLFHGGSPIENPGKTRRSIVTHYFRAEDVPGEHGIVGDGRYYLRRPHPAVGGRHR